MLATQIVLDFFKANPSLFAIYVISSFIAVPLETALIPITVSSFIKKINTNKFTVTSGLVLILVFAIVSVGHAIKKRVENTLIPKMSMYIREWIFRYILNSFSHDYEAIPTNKLSTVFINYPIEINSPIISLIRLLVPQTLGLIVLIIYFFRVNLSIGLLQITVVALILSIMFFRGKACFLKAQVSSTKFIQVNDHVQDRMNNLMSIYASQQENKEISIHSKNQQINKQEHINNLNCSWSIEIASDTVLITSFLVFNYLVFTNYRKGALSTEDVVALFIAEVYYFYKTSIRLVSSMSDIISALGGAKSMENILTSLRHKHKEIQLEPTKNNNVRHSKVPFTRSQPTISMIDVHFKYKNKWILNGLSLNLFENECVWLRGASGSGKSTIFKILQGYVRVNKGEVIVRGHRLTSETTNDIRSHIAIVDQNTKLFDTTVYKNMTYGLKNIKRKDVEVFIKKLNIRVFDKLSKGLDTQVGPNGDNISGGQRQVTHIVRCALRGSSIILMDEPLSAIDPDSVYDVINAIRFLCMGRTSLIISHNTQIQSIVSREIHIDRV